MKILALLLTASLAFAGATACTSSTRASGAKAAADTRTIVTDYRTSRFLALDPDGLICTPEEPDYPYLDATTDRRAQTVAGFGASFTEGCGVILGKLDETRRREALRLMFGSGEGQARISLLRVPMGSSDFGVQPAYTYADRKKGPDGLGAFTMERDFKNIIPYLQEARTLNPDLHIVLAPWSGPAWMKRATKTDKPQLYGGIFNFDFCESYARYFVKAIQGYEGAGIPVYGVVIQNEGFHDHIWYPTMEMPPEDAGRFAHQCLAPELRRAGLSHVKIIGASENFVPATWYAQGFMKTAGNSINALAGHCNWGDFTDMARLWETHPGLELHAMECSGWTTDTLTLGSFRYHARQYVLDSLLNGASSVNFWNLCLTPDAEPRLGGCDTCRPAVGIDPMKGTFLKNPEFFVSGQANQGIRPGAARLLTRLPSEESMVAAAFANPDGTRSILAHNTQDEARLVAFKRKDGRYCRYLVPGSALVTAVWKD